ncbi:rhodanese-like domain-containing protein 11, chloroplastic isoform X1 [Vigna unguiculata]|uniref:rhodanese-like domain-containing protein 11, chloroplastic isoform X1 n=1 Tax=Vigna unguiculata TaxID=3917 RepID=UPI0010163965|nr:rhodanese-like domain-containing protein 11, chloroplastic isoform X1 [Vigna unguiculata]
MEALSLLPINTLTNNHISLTASSNYAPLSSSLQLNPSLTSRTLTLRKRVVRVQAESEDYELKQMRDMAAARKRWEALIRDGKVKVLTPREAGYAVQLSGKPLLDVRPSNERNKAWVRASTWIPIFDVDNKLDFGTVPRKVTNFVMGGWWSGMPTLSYDSQFLTKVAEKFPKDSELIVACQKGLRSLAACELLYNAGYKNLFWVQGGFEAAEEEQDLIVEGPSPLKFAGIGGVSEFLGWTDQQRAAAAKEGWGYRLVFSARLIGVFLFADVLYIGAQQIGRYLQDIRTH